MSEFCLFSLPTQIQLCSVHPSENLTWLGTLEGANLKSGLDSYSALLLIWSRSNSFHSTFLSFSHWKMIYSWNVYFKKKLLTCFFWPKRELDTLRNKFFPCIFFFTSCLPFFISFPFCLLFKLFLSHWRYFFLAISLSPTPVLGHCKSWKTASFTFPTIPTS